MEPRTISSLVREGIFYLGGSLKGIFFDLDGTLIDSMHIWFLIDDEINEYLKHIEDQEFKNKLKYSPIPDIYKIYQQHYGDDLEFKALCDKFDDILLTNYSNAFELREGVLEMIQKLKEKGFKMCLTTATSSKYVMPFVEKYGLEHYFEFILTPDKAGVKKNELEFFKIALEKLGTKSEDTYVFDDTRYVIDNAIKLNLIPVGVYDKSREKYKEEIIEKSKIYIRSFVDFDMEEL